MYDAGTIRVRRVLVMGEELDRISMRAHAKLNLALAVGPPIDAPNQPTHGYHPVYSYMHAIELSDLIEIRRLNLGHTSIFDLAWQRKDGTTQPVEWAPEQDLAFRAHQLLEQHSEQSLPVEVVVRKAIPAGGGLGGGSSDAASVLVGLNQLFGLGLDTTALQSIAMRFGSDIAYFIDEELNSPRPAIVSGFGETIERIDPGHVGQSVSLIVPPFGCHTGQVYAAFDSTCDWDHPDEARVHDLAGAAQLSDDSIWNDLYPPACAIEPRLEQLRDSFATRFGKAVHLSGSGSTLFVLGPLDAGLVHELHPDCRVIHSRLC
jgi:4-diphosphocytidyl-2-C-methyl-D-erythritol kinase